MCYMQVFIINECSWFYFTQSMFISAFISVIMNWYKILRNDTIEYMFCFSTPHKNKKTIGISNLRSAFHTLTLINAKSILTFEIGIIPW